MESVNMSKEEKKFYLSKFRKEKLLEITKEEKKYLIQLGIAIEHQ